MPAHELSASVDNDLKQLGWLGEVKDPHAQPTAETIRGSINTLLRTVRMRLEAYKTSPVEDRNPTGFAATISSEYVDKRIPVQSSPFARLVQALAKKDKAAAASALSWLQHPLAPWAR